MNKKSYEQKNRTEPWEITMYDFCKLLRKSDMFYQIIKKMIKRINKNFENKN